MITEFLPEDKVVWKQYKDYDLYLFSNDFQVKYFSEEYYVDPRAKEDAVDYDTFKYIGLNKNGKLCETISLKNIHKKLFPEYYATEEDEKLFAECAQKSMSLTAELEWEGKRQQPNEEDIER